MLTLHHHCCCCCCCCCWSYQQQQELCGICYQKKSAELIDSKKQNAVRLLNRNVIIDPWWCKEGLYHATIVALLQFHARPFSALPLLYQHTAETVDIREVENQIDHHRQVAWRSAQYDTESLRSSVFGIVLSRASSCLTVVVDLILNFPNINSFCGMLVQQW